MGKKRTKSVTSSSLIPNLVFNEASNAQKCSEAGFAIASILGPIDAAKFCGFEKPILIANISGSNHWVNFGDGSLTTLASAADGVTSKKLLLTAADGVTADVSGVTGTVSSAGQNFTTAGVLPGDLLINASGGADDGTFTILSVDTAHQVTVDTTAHGAFAGLAAQAFTVRSIHLGTFVSAGAGFVAAHVHAGDIVTITNGADAGSYAVTVVVGATTLTLSTTSLPAGFTGVAAENYTVKTVIAPPTDFTNGIMIPPSSLIVLASGTHSWVRSDSSSVGAYVATEQILVDGGSQAPVFPNTNQV